MNILHYPPKNLINRLKFPLNSARRIRQEIPGNAAKKCTEYLGMPPNPVKNLNSQLTHCELTLKLMVSSFWSHSSTSKRTHKMSPQRDLTVSPPWVCNSQCELAVSYLWDEPMSSPCSGSSELTVSMALAHTFTEYAAGWMMTLRIFQEQKASAPGWLEESNQGGYTVPQAWQSRVWWPSWCTERKSA